MTENKPIMIDGVDVSHCKHFKNRSCIADYLLTDMVFSEAKCELCKDCYFKQLARKTQECEELKKVNRHIDNNRMQKANKLMQIEKIIMACNSGYTDEFIQSLLEILLAAESD